MKLVVGLMVLGVVAGVVGCVAKENKQEGGAWMGENMVMGDVVTTKGVDWEGNDDDPESNTVWTKSPKVLTDGHGGYKAIGLQSFEGIEEPTMKWVVADNKAEKDGFTNITEENGGVARMFLRYNAAWWDGDQGTDRKDRQRAEIKGLGPRQKAGEIFEYGTTFRTDPEFKAYGRFCHVMQVKATDGDKGAPLVTLSLMEDGKGALRYVSGKNGKFTVAREFVWKPGVWEVFRFRLKTSETGDGALLLSVNGDGFKGVTGLNMFRPEATEYRPKWGLYRGTVKGMTDDWVEHKEQVARKLGAIEQK